MSAAPSLRMIAVVAPTMDETAWAQALASHGSGHPVAIWPDVDRAAVRYAAVWLPPPGVLAQLPNLEVVFNLGAGVDHLLADPALPDVPVVRSVDPDLTRRMGEYVVLHALAHLRGLTGTLASQRAREWRWRASPASTEVTVGIMGLGVLGREAARRLGETGFRLAGWSRGAKALDGVACHHGADGLDPFLAATDILVCLLPSTSETRGLIDARLIARLKRDGPLGGPVLINAGRGAVHVEADIVAALRSGALVAASLDVFETEPLPASSPLWTMDNVIVTPHSAADSDPAALARSLIRQIAAFEVRGAGALLHRVDRAQGY